jgi:tetratricopeptide (TPR) repeat protein
MTDSLFDFDRASLEAAKGLPAEGVAEFRRLARSLVFGPKFQWLLVDAPHEGVRKLVMAGLDAVLRSARLRSSQLPLSGRIADVAMLEKRLVEHARRSDVVHVVGRPGWFDAQRWDAFNVRRERIAAQARARLVFWLDAEAIRLAATGAPDLWAWRGGVFAFLADVDAFSGAGVVIHSSAPGSASAAGVPAAIVAFDSRSMLERHQRIAELRAFVSRQPPPPDELLIGPLDELGRLLYSLGDYEAALAHWRDIELPLHRRRNDDRAIAITQGQIADILQARGQLDEALRTRREEQLPVFERLGDVWARAVTQGRVADILQARGQLDEALRIRREEQLPVFERLGDVRERAITQAGVAEILLARGQLDEALHVMRVDLLPVFKRLGEVRVLAITQGKVADILQARGQLDEALRIRREEQLPVFERLGDARERAITQGRIAEILEKRGQFDEALRIRREEELPVYERLGDVQARAVTQAQIALQLLERDAPDRDAARKMLDSAYIALRQAGFSDADELARRMTARGFTPPPV